VLSWPARLIDQILLRLTVRQAQLRRRTLWPDAEALRRLRAGDPPAVSLADPGPPTTVTFLDAEGRGPFEFPSSPPYGLPHDRTVQGELFPAAEPSGAAVVLFPGAFTGLNPGLEERFYTRVARAFAGAGVTAVLLTPPLHKDRAALRPDGERERSGHDLLHGDIFTHVRAIAQAARDVRATMHWLQAEHGRVGLWGISLGALVHGLVLLHDARPAFVVLVQPPVGRQQVFDSPLLEVWTRQLRDSGVTPADVEAAFAGLDRGEVPRVPADRILIQAGRHDLVARPEAVVELRDRWGDPRVRWYEHSHTSIFLARRRLIAEALDFAAQALAARGEAV
jgi:hypothetical protein